MRDLLRMRLDPWGVLIAFGFLAALATTFGFLGALFWFFDLFSHFRVQYFVFAAGATTVLALGRRKRTAWLFGLLALINLATVVPAYTGKPAVTLAGNTTHRAMLINVNTGTGEPARVEKAIAEFAPDLLVLEEVNGPWLTSLQAVLKAYPHAETEPREDNFGIAVFSKFPLTRAEVIYLNEAEVPTIIAVAEIPSVGPLTIIATHPLPPSSQENSRLRDDQLTQLATRVRHLRNPALLLGDLNVTPWSAPFKRLLHESGLQNSARGRGIMPTWPTQLPLLYIPLDHCLHSATIQTVQRSVGPRVGSDHLPVIVDFSVAGPRHGT